MWLWVFWALYVLIMGIYRAKLDGRLTGVLLFLSWPWYMLGLTVDFISQMTIATLVFMDLPRELLVTTRLQRYMREGPGWRRSVAGWVCDNLLDVFDPTGSHC